MYSPPEESNKNRYKKWQLNNMPLRHVLSKSVTKQNGRMRRARQREKERERDDTIKPLFELMMLEHPLYLTCP